MKNTGKTLPPKMLVRFFRWYCNDYLAEAALGDIVELYERRVEKLGKTRADILFALNVLSFIQPFAIRQRSSYTQQNNFAMLRSYFKVAWRTMNRQKMYTGITIGGFALGLSTCLLIFLYIRDELSYDKQQAFNERTFRLYNEYQKQYKWVASPASVASILKEEYPDIELSGRLIPYKWYNAGSNLIRKADEPENIYEEGFAYADPSLLEILDIPMVNGSREHALSKPNTMVISEKMSKKYFGSEDPIGKIMILNNDPDKSYEIGGVMQDFPSNSHIQYNFFLTLSEVEFWKGEQTSWCCMNYDTYVRLKPDAVVADVEKKILGMRDTYYVSYLKEVGDQSLADVQKHHIFRLQPLSNLYLNPEGVSDYHYHGSITYLWLFGAIAVFILLLACINFVNLSTARSGNRAKEVGLRKTVGSVRSALVRQFLTESLFYSIISFAIAIIIAHISLPYFNELAAKHLTVPWMTTWFAPLLLVSCIGVGLFAGIYPSVYLSAFKPIDVLKGSFIRGRKSAGLRSAMVVFQFTTSIILIIGTLMINRQMDYILNSKIGFNKDQVLMVQGANTLGNRQKEFKDELLQLADVDHVTISNYLPVGGTTRDLNGFWKEGRTKIDKPIGCQRWEVDSDYIETMGMKLVSGRDFIETLASDTASIIINQAMAKSLELKNPLGERIFNWRPWTVIGVVEDFHFESMKGKIEPLALVKSNGGSIVSVKAKGKDMQALIQKVTKVWTKFMPHQGMRYTFLDEQFARMYEDVNRTGRIFATFSILAIIIACLGLFALSSFMIEQRGKEISVRLVLGASVQNIVQLLGKNFVRLIAISFLISIPLGWYMMKTWLQEFEYKTTMTWDVFALAGGAALMIAMLTISFQSVKAALVNPASRLRSE